MQMSGMVLNRGHGLIRDVSMLLSVPVTHNVRKDTSLVGYVSDEHHSGLNIC